MGNVVEHLTVLASNQRGGQRFSRNADKEVLGHPDSRCLGRVYFETRPSNFGLFNQKDPSP